jgi:hypothetical protein
MDWSSLYPDYFTQDLTDGKSKCVEFADVGCGYGGLLGKFYNYTLQISHNI